MARLVVRLGVAALAAAAVVIPASHPAAAAEPSNTQRRLPDNLYVADLDGDRQADLLQVAANKVWATRTDFEGSPILHHYFDAAVSRLLVGDFTASGREHGKDQVCAILADATISCYAISDDRTELWWWFTQGSFVASDEHAVVGDFDGNGADDILVYKPSTGAVRMYTRAASGFFAPMPGFSLGNLANYDRRNKVLLAGEFGQASGRADLLMYDPAAGQVSRFDSVTDATGAKTFWWAFTTAAGTVRSDEDLYVANIDGGTTDGIVLRNTSTGAYRLRKSEFANGDLAAVTGVSTGQLPVTTHGGRLAFAHLKYLPSEPGLRRDDALFIDTTDGSMRRIDARWDGTRHTYWWAYTKATPAQDTGWSGVVNHDWTVVLCRFRDVSTTPQPATFWRQQFTRGNGGVADFFWDMSYGRVNLQNANIVGPYTVAETSTEVANGINARPQTWDRNDSVNTCVKAATDAGRTVPTSRVILYFNGWAGPGAAGGYVVADPTANSPTFLAHEMGHVYGLNESADDGGNWYADPWDIMSAMRVNCFAGNPAFSSSDNACNFAVTAPSGPGINAGNLGALGYLPSSRVEVLTPGATRRTTTVALATLNRPETSGVLAVRIPMPAGRKIAGCGGTSTCSTSGNYYTVELRQPREWDRAFTQDAVFIHQAGVTNGLAQTSLRNRAAPQFRAGGTFDDGTVRVRVDAIDAARGTATVTITY